MNVVIAALAAYPLTGIHCILRDFRIPFINRPEYARHSSRYFAGFLLQIFGWMPLAIIKALRFKLWNEAVSPIIVFVGLTWLGAAFLF